MSSMRLPMLLSAAFTASFAASVLPAHAQDAVRGTDLDCPAEVAAFLATVRADDAYPQVAEMFADTEAKLAIAVRTDGADCLILLRDAQRTLVNANVVVPGASDPASVERVARLAGEGAPTDTAEPVLRTVEITPPEPATADDPDMTIVDVEPTTSDAATAPDVAADVVVVPDAAIPAIDVPSVARRPEPASDAAVGTEAVAGVDAGPEGLAVREVEFGFDSAVVPDDARTSVLADVAEMLGMNADATVLLTGHASPIGDAAYNLKLSERRVAAVAEALLSLGVPEGAISTRAQGERNPEVRAGEDELSEENRRVEILVVIGEAADRG